MNFSYVISILFTCTLILYLEAVEGAEWKLYEEQDLDLEGQLQLINKPAVKIIHTFDGDKYDCVDFYKQPYFDHPSTENYTLDLDDMKPSPRVVYKKRDNLSSRNMVNGKLEGRKCPVGTIPIRRHFKDNLHRVKHASNIRSLIAGQNPDAHYAVIKTIDSPRRYSGAVGFLTLYKPVVGGFQYSAARLVLKNGPDSIEVGWRVDPLLNGDDKCRMFIRTTVNNVAFLNLWGLKFKATSNEVPVDVIFSTISERGGNIYYMKFEILRDGSGNWVLTVDEQNIQVGYWPKEVFSSDGLTQLASYIEWGGEVFSPKGVPKPPMGSGQFPVEDSKKDCLFFQIQWVNEDGKYERAYNLETFADSQDYKIIDVGVEGDTIGLLVLFGGPGGKVTL